METNQLQGYTTDMNKTSSRGPTAQLKALMIQQYLLAVVRDKSLRTQERPQLLK
jgi:hypothetical protein